MGWREEIFEAEKLLNTGKSIAIQDVENHLVRKEDKDYFYFEMREQQLEILKSMLPIVSSLNMDLKQKEMFADYLENLSQNVNSNNTTDHTIRKLDKYKEVVSNMALPKTREEFETRANLFYLMQEIYRYLNIKKELFERLEEDDIRK